MSDLSSVAREAAEREGLRRIPASPMALHGGVTVDMAQFDRNHFIAGFTECASRIPSEAEIARAMAGSEDQGLSELPDDVLENIYGKQARAVLELIERGIRGEA